jgi:glutaredoxin
MELKLYMFEICPFCRKVLNEIESSGRTDVELHNIHKSELDRMELISGGGKQQVPCLFIDGKPMYESDDIVAWLRANPQQV